LFRAPLHPYTRALLSALPIPDPRHRLRRLALHGDVPTALNPPSGCRFHTRCPAVFERCPREAPPLYELPGGRQVRCFHAEGLSEEPRFAELMDERVRSAQQATEMQRAAVSLPAEPSESVAVPGAPSGAPGRQRHWALMAALGLCVIALVWFGKTERPAERARREMQALAHELVAQQRASGHTPAQLSELGYRLHFVFPEGDLTDPWGTGYVYEVSAEAFALKSLGPDKKPSGDDLVHESRWTSPGAKKPENEGAARP
jgi:oligopeptide/dipeptide ABC transporter ATP-binding protein